ncbi:MAG TPA: hypothetical protein VJ998_01430, partial [Pseudomonadales bacterium]|nr:hypothetical protein [Pseudomonadales bacterium]
LPHRHHLLAETIEMPVAREGSRQLVLHTGWGARVNRPFAMALEAGWREMFDQQPEIYVTNQMLIVQLAQDITLDELLGLAPARDLDMRLRQRLEGSGFFGARFRENAARALLLSRGRFNERKPLWMSRLQSQKLLSSVMKYEDFPILLETWRTCLKDEFDLVSLRALLDELERGEICITQVGCQTPSPFAQTASWGQVNTYMYMTDDPRAQQTSALRMSLIEEVAASPELRPRLPRDIIAAFEARRQRLAPGYAPEGDVELLEWVKERTAVPENEWVWVMPETGLSRLRIGDAQLIVATEDRDALLAGWAPDNESDIATTHLANWLQYYGPLSANDIGSRLGLDVARLETMLAELVEEQTLVCGKLVDADECDYWCDAANYEVLLRFMRQSSRMVFETLSIEHLPLFLHTWQTRFASKDPMERIFETIERFRCLPLPARFWESELLPARLDDYDPNLLDILFQEGNLLWVGAGTGRISFCFVEDLDLMATGERAPSQAATLFQATSGRHDFSSLSDKSGLPAAELNALLWDGVWQGDITNDSVTALRKGIDTGFRMPDVTSAASNRRRSVRRGSFNRWRGSLPVAGNWYPIAWPDEEPDLLATEELNKDRVRVLLDRYGILFRELLARESPEFSWRALFRSIRLMELSGEIVSGYFFEGIAGPQFLDPAAFRLLQRGLDKNAIFRINAADPVSLAGVGLESMKGTLPRRVATSHMVYHGDRLVLVSERSGRSVTINVPADDEHLPGYLDVFRHMLYRKSQPLRKIQIEEINGEPAAKSPWLEAFITAFDVIRDYKAVYIQRQI